MANKETMKTKDKKMILRRVFLILGILGIVLGIILTYNYKPITKKVNCYDKYGSKILNQTCEKTPTFPEEAKISFAIGLVFLSVYVFLIPSSSFGLEDLE